MPVYFMQQAEIRDYPNQENEEQKSRVTEELGACNQFDKRTVKKLEKFLLASGVQHLAEMDYPLRQEYEYYLQNTGYTYGAIRLFIKTYDAVKQYEIAKQMETLSGRQNCQWRYRNAILFLPYHSNREIAEEFMTTRQRDILVWDFEQRCSEVLKRQIFDTLNHVIETNKNQILRKNKLLALQEFYRFCIQQQIENVEQLEQEHINMFQQRLEGLGHQARQCYMPIIRICQKHVFVSAEKIHWQANVWYLERFHIGKDRLNESSSLESISFLEIKREDHRVIAQAYMKYELGVTGQSLSTITRRYMAIRNFLQYLENENACVTNCTAVHIEGYVKKLLERKIVPKGFNERLSGIGHFFRFMEVRNYISKVPFRMEYYMQKVVNFHHDRSVEYEAYMEILQKLYKFPEHLRCMFLHLWCLGLRASEICMLKGNAYEQCGRDRWIQIYQVKMKTYKRIPIPDGLYEIMQVYLKKHGIQPEDYIFQNQKGGAFLYQTFRIQMLKACAENRIQNGDYIFQSHDYRHTVATMFYDNKVSIQSIRDYLGHTYEEMTRQYIDYMPQKIAEANEQYFSNPGNSLAACLKKGESDGRE